MNFKTAQEYIAFGFSLLPVYPANYSDPDKRKRPVVSLLPSGQWSPLQHRKPTDAELLEFFGHNGNDVALIGGVVSGGLVCVDVDTKADITGHLLEDFEELLLLENQELYNKLTRQKTVSGGQHWIFKTQQQIGNKGLACRLGIPERPGEIDEKTGKAKKIKLIETKAEGGYFLVSPSQGYDFLSGDLSTIPTLTGEEVETIFSIARSFDKLPQEHKVYVPAQKDFNGLTPWDDYNEQATIADVLQCLEGVGWTAFPQNEGYRLRRPDATKGTHASLNLISALPNFFHCFTESAAPFEGAKTYSPFAVLALCQYDGDFSKAAKELFKQGYGKRVSTIEKKPEEINIDNSCWSASESRALIASLLLTEPEPFTFLVPGLLTKGVCGFLYGEGGSYKSLAALWLCVQRAAGFVANSKWLDRFEIFGAGKSMFCSIEDPIIDIHHRLKAVVNRFCEIRSDVSRQAIQGAIEESFHLFPRERWMQDGFEHIVDIDGKPTLKTDFISKYAVENSIDLIILDTLSRLSLVEENDNNGAARLVSALERIRDKSGASVLVIAHTGKTGRTGKTDIHGQNGLRGASALMDNARFGLWFRSLENKEGKPRLEILNAKTFRTIRAEPFKVQVDYPAFTLLEDDDAENDLMGAVVEDVRANPGTMQRGTCARLKRGRTAINQAYKDAIAEGKILFLGKSNGYKINN